MILLDTNILSTFAAVDRLKLLEEIFLGQQLALSVNVLKEIKNGKEKGYIYLEEVLSYIHQKKISVLELTKEEQKIAFALPAIFGSGEREGIAIAKVRNYVFVTNEEKAVKYCLKENITCLWLNVLLRSLWSEKIMTKEQVRELIIEIEARDRLKIVNQEEIFSE